MSPVPDRSATNNSVLLELIEQLTDLLHRGEVDKIEVLLVQHPEHSDRLRKLLPVLQVVGGLDACTANVTSRNSATDSLVLSRHFAPESLAGTLGDYQILRQVGRGGMGVVYEAEQISLNRRVALKVLPFAGMLDERKIERFRNEARAAALLQHEHIVPIYGVGCERGVHFYAMQFIDAATLSDVIRDLKLRQSSASTDSSEKETQHLKPPAPDAETSPASRLSTEAVSKTSHWRNICTMVSHIAEALEHAHSMGVSHRDIKPSNLLLDKRGKIWITDFGLAQIDSVESLTFTGDILGTLRYMSPEQALGDHRRIDHRTDIYSLGITLYELLALRPAFAESERRSLIRQVMEDEPKPLRQWDASIPRDLETIVQKATQKSPEDRYRTVHELAEDLAALLSHQPIRAKRPTTVDRLGKWSQRHRLALVSSIGVLLLAVIGLLISTSLILHERNAARAAEVATRKSAVAAERSAAKTAELLYASDMRIAGEAVLRGDTGEASALLSRHAPVPGWGQRDARRIVGLEWFYLKQRIVSSETVYSQAESLRSLVEIHGRNQVSFCGPKGVLCVLQLETGQTLEIEPVETVKDSLLAISKDGGLLAVADPSGLITIWDTSEWTLESAWQLGDKDVYDLLFSDDSSYLIIASRQTQVQVYHSKTGKLVRLLDVHKDFVNDLSLSADGKLLACCSYDARSSLWRWETGELLHLTEPGEHRLTCVAISPRGDFWLDSSIRGEIRMMDIGYKETALLRRLPTAVQSMSFSLDGRLLAVGCRSGNLHLLDIDSTFAKNRQLGGATIDLNSQYWKSCEAHLKRIGQVAWLDSQSIVSSGDDGRIAITRPIGEQEVNVVGISDVRKISISSSGRWIAAHNQRQLQLSDTISGHTCLLAEAPTKSIWAGLSFSPDEKELFVTTDDGLFQRIRLVDKGMIQSGVTPFQSKVGLVRFSSDGRRMLMFSDLNDQVVVVAYPSLELLFRSDSPDASHGALSPDGKQLVTNFQRNLLLYDVESGELLRESRDHHSETITDLRFTPNGRLIATSSDDRTVRVWDPSEDDPPKIVGVHPDGIPQFLAVSSDGRTLITSSRNGQVWAWSLPALQKLVMFSSSSEGYRTFEISANDAILVTVDLHGGLHWIRMK